MPAPALTLCVQEIALINPSQAIPVINYNGALKNKQILQLKALSFFSAELPLLRARLTAAAAAAGAKVRVYQ